MIATVVAAYFVTGFVLLVLFDLVTQRIRSRLRNSVYEVHERLATLGFVTSIRASYVIFSLVLFVFWPAVAYGAVTTIGNRGTDDRQKGE